MGVRAAVASVVAGVLVLGAAAVVVDRVADARAERSAQEAISSHVAGAVGTPEVHIQGFPFLTQVWSGSLEHVSGSIAGATLAGTTARDVQFDARGVHLAEPRTADQVTLSATVPTSAIRTALAERTGMVDLQLAVRDGALVLSGEQLGVPVQVTGTPAVHESMLTLSIRSVMLGTVTIDVADLPIALRTLVADLSVPIQDLPDGLSLSAATVVSTGVRVTATGTHVAVPAGGG
jgi:hypothetical protein